MIFSRISFDESIDNPIVTANKSSSFKSGYYAIENILTGSNVIFYVFSLHHPNAIESPHRLQLPLPVKSALFENTGQPFLVKLQPVEPLKNGDCRLRIKLKQVISENNPNITIKASQLNIFLFELTQKINFQEALYNRLSLKDQLVCTGSYFTVSILKWILTFKVTAINPNNTTLKVMEYRNMAVPIDENTKFSINYFPPRPDYSLLLNTIRLPMNHFFIPMLENMLLHESSKPDSGLFPHEGLSKCRKLLTVLDKNVKSDFLPRFCLLKVNEDPQVVDNLFQVFLKGIQKSVLPNLKIVCMDAFDSDAELQGNNGVPLSHIKAIKTIVKASKMEENALMVVFFSGMKSLQLSKKHISFLKYCNEAFQEVNKVLIMFPVFFDKQGGNPRKFGASEIEAQYHDTIEVSLGINSEGIGKMLKNLDYMGKFLV